MTTATQLVLFESDDGYSQTIDLYDIAPRFVVTPTTDPAFFSKPIRHNFSHRNVNYRITVRPAQITKDDGSEGFAFPGEREQIIEKVIRKIATQKGRLNLNKDDIILRFTIHEIRMELVRVNHSFTYAEIKEALRVLHSSIIEIQRVDENKETRIVSASAFPTMILRFGLSDEQDTHLSFNPLVATAIKNLHFRQISYETEMSLPTALSRWLYTRIFQTLVHKRDELVHKADGNYLSLYANQIKDSAGLGTWKRERDLFRFIERNFDSLISEGLIEYFERENVKEGRKIADAIFHLKISDKFRNQLLVSAEKAKLVELIAVEHNVEPDKFQKLLPGDAFRMRGKTKMSE